MHDQPSDPGPPDPTELPTSEQASEAISEEILRIHHESYGHGGAESARTQIGDGYVVVILDDIELAPHEEFLVSKGEQDAVMHVRSQYQQAIQGPFRDAVERATGRRVIGFASTTNVNAPRFMAEVFKLA